MPTHRWPPSKPPNRIAALEEAVRDCHSLGLSPREAHLLIRDWNRSNRSPVQPEVLGAAISTIYRDVPTADSRPEPPAFLKCSDRWDDAAVPRDWLIPGFLPARDRVGLLGRWGEGKGWLSLEAALSVATGTQFLGTRSPFTQRNPTTGNVVILDGEGGQKRILNRLSQLRAGLAATDSQTGVHVSEIYWRSAYGLSLWHATTPGAWTAKLRRLLEPLEPKLVILDTLSKVMGLPDENSNSAAARVTSELYELNQRLGCAILLLAHPPKEGGTSTIRGAGELSADLDVLWTLRTRPDKTRNLICHKDRDGDLSTQQFGFTFEPVANGTTLRYRPTPGGSPYSATSLEEQILHQLGSSATVGARGSELVATIQTHSQYSRSAIYESLKSLTRQGLISNSAGRWSLTPKSPAAIV